MIGRTLRQILCAAAITCLAVHGADAALAKGSAILPKKDSLPTVTTPGDKTNVDHIGSFNWPVTVKNVNGSWLMIADDGAYTAPGKLPVTGWVRKDDVVELAAAPNGPLSTYTGAIVTATKDATTASGKKKLARLYWLRGVYWETATTQGGGGQPQIALEDYRQATSLDSTLTDAWLRQGRMLVKIDPVGSQYDDPDHQWKGWQTCFETAHGQLVYAAVTGAGAPSSGCQSCKTCCAPTTPQLTWQQCVTKPQLDHIGKIQFMGHIAPQLYVDLGLAYQSLYDANWKTAQAANTRADDAEESAEAMSDKARIWAAIAEHWSAAAKGEIFAARKAVDEAKSDAERAKCWAHFTRCWANAVEAELNNEFNEASVAFQWAACSNPLWYLPPSSLGDLLLDKVDLTIGDNLDQNGRPKNAVCADDLFEAIRHYDQSIRLYDQFDGAFRGRAIALRLLAVSARPYHAGAIPPSAYYPGLFSSDTVEKANSQNALLDIAYESAKSANFATNDRNAKNLEIRGLVEVARAYSTNADLGFEDIAKATETIREATLLSESIDERNKRASLVSYTGVGANWVLASIAAEDDIEFAPVWNDAKKMSGGIDRLWGMLQSGQVKDAELGRVIARAHHAVHEIDSIQTFSGPKDKAADAKGNKSPSIWAAIYVMITNATTGPGTDTQPPISDNKPNFGTQPWPNAFPTRAELVARNAKIDNWVFVLKNIKDVVADYNDYPAGSVFDELKRDNSEWK
jgi:hypothetical protein